jgi:hypothetical protein
LHNTGAIDLNKPSTWHVRVSDEAGQELALLSNEDFIAKFAADPSVQAKLTKSSAAANKIDWTDIKLDGARPTAALSKQDALYVLKSYLGV